MTKNSTDKRYIIGMFFTVACSLGLNLAGNEIAVNFNLPFWLDTIGTIFTAWIGGPLWGMLTGSLTNLIMGINNISAIIFCIVNAAIGIIVGICSRKNYCVNIFNVLCMSVFIGIIATVCSIPANYFIHDGMTGNVWGDALFDMLSIKGFGLIPCMVLSIIFLEIPDKIISVLMGYGLVKLMVKIGFLKCDKQSGYSFFVKK